MFDFDGTLVDSNAIKRDAFYEVARGHVGGAAVLDGIFADRDAGDRFQVFRRFAEAVAPAEAVAGLAASLAAEYGRITEERIAACPETEGAGALLSRLAEVPLYLYSATPEDSLRRTVARRGWSGRFGGVFGGPRVKPDILRHVSRLEGIEPPAMVVVGDGADDRAAAREVGCAFVAVGPAAGGAAVPLDAVPDLIEEMQLAGTECAPRIQGS